MLANSAVFSPERCSALPLAASERRREETWSRAEHRDCSWSQMLMFLQGGGRTPSPDPAAPQPPLRADLLVFTSPDRAAEQRLSSALGSRVCKMDAVMPGERTVTGGGFPRGVR